MTDRESAVVKWFNNSKGYGFIQRDNAGDVFVHYCNILGVGYRTLDEGQRAEFEIVERVKGPQAQNVHIVDSISDIKLVNYSESWTIIQYCFSLIILHLERANDGRSNVIVTHTSYEIPPVGFNIHTLAL